MTNSINKMLSASAMMLLLFSFSSSVNARFFERFEWTEVNAGSGITWEPRAGLQAVTHRGKFYVLGGRAPKISPVAFGDSSFFNDVWESADNGVSWQRLTDNYGAPWAARAYFQTVTKGRYMYVLGGQDSTAILNPDPTCGGIPVPGPPCPQFILDSTFFNDVWRSRDGSNWQRLTNDAAWPGRAGLSAVTHRGWIYVMGGSVNDDSAIIGPGGAPRKYFNDVYKSRNGKKWYQVTGNAPWSPRAGAVVVSRGTYMYILGGEDGFICNSSTPRCPPYFNDVWRSRDGSNWTRVTADAGWSARPGHQCEVLFGYFICFGGFGLSDDPTAPFKPSNPVDIWISADGKHWKELAGSASPPWKADSPADIKYDFAAFPVYFVNRRFKPSIYTFGGDRETFDPFDFEGFLKVDNDVWRYGLEWQ